MSDDGLRERSRRRRHEAIHHAALRLFAERGYDATTIADIADAAEVAPRTVSLYFPSKLAIALSFNAASSTRMTDAFSNRTSEETALDVIERWITSEAHSHSNTLALQRAMLQANPAFRGAENAESLHARQVAVRALADDLGRSGDDVIVALAGGAIAGVVTVVLELDLAGAELTNTIDDAMRMLRAAIHTLSPG